MNTRPLEIRFWEKVNKTKSCWLWTASTDKNGYGQIGMKVSNSKYTMRIASRVSWELTRGEIPKDKCVLHRCDIPACVNPKHLFLGTLKDNSQDMSKKLRFPKGMIKLTKNQILEIRLKYKNNTISQYDLAKEYKISQSQIWKIIHKLRWKHI